MGSWGIKALENDAGLDIIHIISETYQEKSEIKLSEIILDRNYFPEDYRNNIDYYYDVSAMVLTEIYLDFKEKGSTDLQKLEHIESIVADKKSIQFLLQMLYDIRDEKPDQDGMRELTVLWKESKLWNEWQAHLLDLIFQMKILKAKIFKEEEFIALKESR
jgi:hypothetical protein